MEQILQEMLRIARLAGAKVKELRDKGALTEDLKDGVELVTNADLMSNDIIKHEVAKLFPAHVFLSEEDAVRSYTLDKPTWIIDPIDGTVNFANGHFMAAVSIAYAENYEVRAAVVYNPFLDEMFYASEDSGAFLNGRPIRVKDVSALKSCLVATGFPYVKLKEDVRALFGRMERLLPNIGDFRRLGSAALDICWVACGRLQCYYEGHLNAWDVAAARLIAKEAGASIGYFKEPTDELPDTIRSENLIVSSPGVYEELKSLLV
ncbi:myo-inositol-1(or 4)-monophosphatase [Sporobacter termitidis DSM 10068]|uniref:Inositol-1-monophosphatase n=1 Tax=Sporobacter termitidis DSM 10068 TaxID=1123282 RepID=A0A1M5VNZ4_9FIRM|nr:myo-inositol-1(or 4)-monophosphatase [Sporobacter termitidis DSM 10068]